MDQRQKSFVFALVALALSKMFIHNVNTAYVFLGIVFVLGMVTPTSYVNRTSDYLNRLFSRKATNLAVAVFATAMIAITFMSGAHAQVAGGDAATIIQAAVTYFEGPFGVALASIGLIIVAILLFVGRHSYEAMLLGVVAIAIYFGGPGLIQAIAGGV